MTIGTLTGTFLVPGVSKNQRLYTESVIRDSVNDMSRRLGEQKPVAMMARHGTESILEQCATVRSVWVDEEGRGHYSADIPDTDAGRNLKKLTDEDTTGQRHLNAVSIYGGWLGDVRTVEHEGQQVVTGDKLLISRIDFTSDPGVDAARLDPETATAPEAAAFEQAGVSFHPLSEDAPPAQFHDAPADAPAPAATTTPAESTASGHAAVIAGLRATAEAMKPLRDAAEGDARDALTEAMVRIMAFTDSYDTDVSVSSYGVDNANLAASAARLGAAASAAIQKAEGTSDTDADADAVAAALSDESAPPPDIAPGATVDAHCADCSTDLPAESRYCPGCGGAVPEKGPDMATPATEISATKCGGCKGDVPANAKFCPNCGAETKKGDETSPGQEINAMESSDLAALIGQAVTDGLAKAGISGAPAATDAPTDAGTGDATGAEATGQETTTQTGTPATEGGAPSQGSVQDIVAAAIAKERETWQAEHANDIGEAVKAAVAQTTDALREHVVANGGAQRKGVVERVLSYQPPEKPLHELEGSEKAKAQNESLAAQMDMAGYPQELITAVRGS